MKHMSCFCCLRTKVNLPLRSVERFVATETFCTGQEHLFFSPVNDLVSCSSWTPCRKTNAMTINNCGNCSHLLVLGFATTGMEKAGTNTKNVHATKMERNQKSGQNCKFGVSKLGVLLCLVTTTFLLDPNETSKTTLYMLKKNGFCHAQETRKACLWKHVLNCFTVKADVKLHRLTKKQFSDNGTVFASLPRCFVQKRRKTDVAHWD